MAEGGTPGGPLPGPYRTLKNAPDNCLSSREPLYGPLPTHRGASEPLPPLFYGLEGRGPPFLCKLFYGGPPIGWVSGFPTDLWLEGGSYLCPPLQYMTVLSGLQQALQTYTLPLYR